MELRHLRYFVAVAEMENVSRAALKLHLSQPALSRQIRDLEDELGFALLEHSAKSVRLTKAGRVFLVQSRAVLQRAEEAVFAARAAAKGEQGELHVGYAPTLTARILPPTLRAFHAASPGMRVKLHDLSTQEMLAALRNGKVQLALTVRPSPAALRGLAFEALLREPLLLAVPPAHPLAGRRRVPLGDAAREPLLGYSRSEYPEYHRLLRDLFAAARPKPRIAQEHDGVSSLISAIESGSGVAIVPKSLSCFAGPRLKLVPLSPEPPPLVIGILRPKNNLARSAAEFIRCAQQAGSQAAPRTIRSGEG